MLVPLSYLPLPFKNKKSSNDASHPASRAQRSSPILAGIVKADPGVHFTAFIRSIPMIAAVCNVFADTLFVRSSHGIGTLNVLPWRSIVSVRLCIYRADEGGTCRRLRSIRGIHAHRNAKCLGLSRSR